MTTITKEQAQKIIDAADEVITALAGTNEDVHPESDNMLRLWDDLNDRYAPPEIVRELARIALASLEAEAVAWRVAFRLDGQPGSDFEKTFENQPKMNEIISLHERAGFSVSITPFYTAPPEPVFPATLPCAVELKPGLIIGKGCKTETLLTALQRRADYYAEIDAMTPEERAEHDANIEAFKAMLPQQTPVVPEEATPKNIEMLASARVRNVTFQWDEDERNAAADSWNACRAAVLNGGKS